VDFWERRMRLDRFKRLSRVLSSRALSSRAFRVTRSERGADGAAVAARGGRGWTVTLAEAETVVAEQWTVGRELSDSQLDHVNGGWCAHK
jgi:hypothetical protein